MSAEREGEPDGPERPNGGRGLRLIKTPEAKRPEPGPELKAILDGIRRHSRAHRERAGRGPDDKDVA